jgi:hypothetical protein
MGNISKDWKEVIQPKLALDYNKNTAGIDQKDEKLQPYLLERKRGINSVSILSEDR